MPASAGAIRADQPAAAARPAKRIKLLAGAPDPARLSWDEDALLINDWTPAARRFLDRKFAEEPAGAPATAASHWRSISTSPHALLHTGFTQESPVRADFFYAPTFASTEHSSAHSSQPSVASPLPAAEEDEEEEDSQDQFLEHSIAVHDSTHSSQLAPPDDTTTLTLASTPSPSSSSSSSRLSTPDQLPPAHLPRTITSLRAIPPAAHLARIAPQTVVVSLVAGVMQLPPARAVRTRRGARRELVELVVGDETASGLRVSFWFADGEEGVLRAALRALRLRDVVLVENVALDAFRGRVFGYALRRSLQKNQTRVEVLARGGVDRFAGLAGVEKVEGVKDWVFGLVNPGVRRMGEDGGEGRDEDIFLPPDTQE
ncbi:hypothetical protein GTA08_BOTSDO13567 [Neofusicoccum parvum]|uniref:Uncharacterized protein n=1 Tax=Neofusicoccum parvum TaxID=310453 RepID=A0ACB5RQ55_9PEZI|nr:hypothetical protein GTA08_BOTSDO13567 [Neofusicoccum parvum]